MSPTIECLIFSIVLLACVIGFVFFCNYWFDKKDGK